MGDGLVGNPFEVVPQLAGSLGQMSEARPNRQQFGYALRSSQSDLILGHLDQSHS